MIHKCFFKNTRLQMNFTITITELSVVHDDVRKLSKKRIFDE